MPRGRTDLQPELIGLVCALRRHAGRVRRSASHDKAAERLRAFADYLDAKADALEAPVIEIQPGPAEQRIGVAA